MRRERRQVPRRHGGGRGVRLVGASGSDGAAGPHAGAPAAARHRPRAARALVHAATYTTQVHRHQGYREYAYCHLLVTTVIKILVAQSSRG